MNAIANARQQAVKDTVDRIKQIERDQRVTPESLQAIKAELIDLARRRDLFPTAEFDRDDTLYSLTEDDNGRFALYLYRGGDGKSSPPA